MPGQPQATDFTEICPSDSWDALQKGEFVLRVILDSGQLVTLAKSCNREELENLELAINQAMIEYRTKRNAYERENAPYCKECRIREGIVHRERWEKAVSANKGKQNAD